MITVQNSSNAAQYRALFDRATDLLAGYKKIYSYNKDITDYYIKNENGFEHINQQIDAETGESLQINSLLEFAEALNKFKTLYVETEKGPVDGFEPTMGISTLEEYFSRLNDLSNLDEGKIYTKLPLDEDHFVINANTRAINIPNNFKKNGIAVQGDNLAEVVYFEIDRYFDYMDLNNTEILIQWETPKTTTTEAVKSISKEYLRDIESKPGKLIFGWAISEAISSVSGSLKFSVKFLKWNEDKTKVVYAFNTLVASVSIQPSIGIDIMGKEPEDVGDLLLDRIENSSVIGGLVAEIPKFEIDLISNVEGYDFDQEGENELRVLAYTGDTGFISYEWRHFNEEGTQLKGRFKEGDERVITEYIRVTTLDELNNYSAKGIYFYNSDGTRYTNDLPTSLEILESYPVYVKHSVFKPEKIGKYRVVASNRVTNSIKTSESVTVVYPSPEEPEIKAYNETMEKGGVIKGEEALKLSVTAKVPLGGEQQLSYQWYRNENYMPGEYTLSDYELIEGATGSEYTPEAPGYYCVNVNNNRNMETKTITSDFSKGRITPAAKPLTYAITNGIRSFYAQTLSEDNCPTITINYFDENENKIIESDNVLVQWWLSTADADYEITTMSLGGQLETCSFNPSLPTYAEKIKELSKEEDIYGNYYAIVINDLNSDQISSSKPDLENMFTVA